MQAVRGAVQGGGVRRHRRCAEQNRAVVNLHVGHGRRRAESAGRDRQVRRVGVVRIVRRAVHINDGGARHVGCGHGVEREIKSNVAAVHGVLVNLGRDDVVARDEQRGGKVRGEEGLPVVRRHRRGQRGIGRGTGRHVVAEDFGAVEINNHAIITQEIHDHVRQARGVRNVEVVPVIGGDVFVGGGGSEAVDRGLITLAIAELGRAGSPATVIKARRLPVRALIGAVVQILPSRVRADERGGRCTGADNEVDVDCARPEHDGVVPEWMHQFDRAVDRFEGRQGVTARRETGDHVAAV